MMRPRVALLFGGLLLSAAHFASPASAQPGGIIRGVVTDERTGAPIEFATVRVNRSDGRQRHDKTRVAFYEFSDLPAGQYWIELLKLGYVPENYDGFECRGGCDFEATYVTLAAGATIIANAALEPLASVSGTVRDAGSMAPIGPGVVLIVSTTSREFILPAPTSMRQAATSITWILERIS